MQSLNSRTIPYRADIDGLRGVSVALVLLYHLGVGFCKGGFIGVDVFFVISGFLITSIISAEIKNGTFSFLHFYERRIRRLFPALFAMLFFSSVAAYFILFPPELITFGKSLASAVMFAANFYFLRAGGYFADGADMAPLNHTWSLGVEEQYYLIFPIFLIALIKWVPNRLGMIIWIAGACFLAISEYLTRRDPDAAFYLINSRMWELLAGAAVALGAAPRISRKSWGDVVGLLGLAAIIVAGLALNRKIHFPGLVALIPCMGAVFVIISGQERNTIVYKLLANPAINFLGLISYSLYLWHYPVISFYKWMNGPELSNLEMAGLGAASMAIAVCSFVLIERPFRKRGGALSQPVAFALAASVMIIALAVSAAFVVGDGLEARFPVDVLKFADFRNPPTGDADAGVCFLEGSRSVLEPRCLQPKPGFRNVLLIGDSHAGDLKTGFERAIPGCICCKRRRRVASRC